MGNTGSNPEEANISRDRGFNRRWPVDENYQIMDGIIRPFIDGKFIEAGELVPWREAHEYYYPIGRPELPGEFAKLANGSEKKVLEFVKRYGLLGYRQVVESAPPRLRDYEWYLRSAAEQGGLVNPETVLKLFENKVVDKGDPLDWVLGHAATVDFVLRLSESLSRVSSLRREINLIRSHDDYEGVDEVVFRFQPRVERKSVEAVISPLYDSQESAMQVIQMILNDNLVGVRRSLFVESKAQIARRHRSEKFTLEPTFEFQSLLDCIYWLVADAVLGETIKKCLHCKRYFVATTKRRKYCPPRKGNRGPSSCQNVHQVTLYRDRQKRLKRMALSGKSTGAQTRHKKAKRLKRTGRK